MFWRDSYKIYLKPYAQATGSMKNIILSGLILVTSTIAANSNENNLRSFNNEIFNGEIINNGLVRFELKSPTRVKLNFKLKAANQLIKSHYADTGSPHVFIEIEDVLAQPKDLNSRYRNIANFPVFEIGKEIRYHKDFSPMGTNVNFIQIKNDEILIRTYERGVEKRL